MSTDTQESISSSSVQSMGEPVAKKQKVNAGYECAITGIKVTSETSVQIGRERIWAPALVLFSKYFSSLGNQPLEPFLAEAQAKAKEKDMTSPFTNFVMSELQEVAVNQDTNDTMNELNIQRFWLLYLEVLEKKLLHSVKLDTTLSHTTEICRLFYNLSLLLHTLIPVEGLASINRLCKTLDEVLMGETFWEYNPILLTQVHIWAHEFLDSVFKDHAGPIKKNHIALSLVLAQAQHPFPGLKVLSESQVCDQQLAIRLARNELDEFDEEPGIWSLNTTYAYTSGFLNTNYHIPGAYAIAVPNYYVGVTNW